MYGDQTLIRPSGIPGGASSLAACDRLSAVLNPRNDRIGLNQVTFSSTVIPGRVLLSKSSAVVRRGRGKLMTVRSTRSEEAAILVCLGGRTLRRGCMVSTAASIENLVARKINL